MPLSGLVPQQQRTKQQRLSSSTSVLEMAATNSEEDLELTRQIIFEHIRKNDFVDDAMLDDYKRGTSGADRPENDLLMRAAVGEKVEKTPLWLFRQAGRHLPEYTALKEERGENFLELLASPDAVAECTMQPVRRYDLDAAILFSDILVVPEALGIEVTMPGGVGILVPNPLKSPEEIDSRLPTMDKITPAFVQDKLNHVLTAVKKIRSQMKEEGISIPLIGFSAAPWTLFFYMVGGSSKKNKEIGMQWLKEHPEQSTKLLQLLTKIVIEYCSAQVDSGAHVLQIFEAMGMMIDEENFEQFALPCLSEIGAELAARHPEVPLMVFARGACDHANSKLAAAGHYNVITMDGATDRKSARAMADQYGVSLQGNYDPAEMIEANGKTSETVRATAVQMLNDLGPSNLIANLGEGLGGKESPALVDVFVNAIHEESAAMIASVAE